jgi:hypothetical protein
MSGSARSPTDNEVRIYRGTVDPSSGNATHVEVEGLDGTHPLLNHTDTDFAWGYGGAPLHIGSVHCYRHVGSGRPMQTLRRWRVDPDSGREKARCRDCGGDGWPDLVAVTAPVVKGHLIAPLNQDAPFELSSDQVMDIILRVCMNAS